MDSNQPQKSENTSGSLEEVTDPLELIGRYAVLLSEPGLADRDVVGDIVKITNISHYTGLSSNSSSKYMCAIDYYPSLGFAHACVSTRLKLLPKETEITPELRAWMKKCYGK